MLCSTGAHRLRPSQQPAAQPAHVQRVQPIPSSTIAAGVTIDRGNGRKRDHGDAGVGEGLQEYIGNSTIATIDSATVIAENSTVRPAVPIVRISASFRLRRRPARHGTG